MNIRKRLAAALLGTAVITLSTVHAPPAEAFAGTPEDVRFVEITHDHVDLTFVDMSTAETSFQVEYKQLGTTIWSLVRTYRDHRAGQPAATGVTIRINDLPHNGTIGGCYKVWAVGTNVRLGTAQHCTAEVPHGMKMARMLSWTQTSESSYNGWLYGLEHQSLFREFEFTWATDYCTSSPDQPSGFDFRLPCLRHDFGYRNYERLGAFSANKSRVDSAFYADMRRKCDTYFIAVRPACYSLAAIYYEAVSIFGVLSVSQETIDHHTRWRAELQAQ
ncbi:phospholipase [Actinomycetes bacterium KLBMP 9797]